MRGLPGFRATHKSDVPIGRLTKRNSPPSMAVTAPSAALMGANGTRRSASDASAARAVNRSVARTASAIGRSACS